MKNSTAVHAAESDETSRLNDEEKLFVVSLQTECESTLFQRSYKCSFEHSAVLQCIDDFIDTLRYKSTMYTYDSKQYRSKEADLAAALYVNKQEYKKEPSVERIEQTYLF